MHFAKAYTQLLLSLPPKLRDNAIQYRQLKKLINQIVRELSSLGLSPAVLQELLDHVESEAEKIEKADSTDPISDEPSTHNPGKIVYEVTTTSGHIEPRLRLWVNSGITSSESGGSTPEPSGSTSEDRSDSLVGHGIGGTNISLLWALQRGTRTVPCGNAHISEVSTSDLFPNRATRDGGVPIEVVIPLVSDTAFFQMLSMAIHHVSAHLIDVQSDFFDTLRDLSRNISDLARPASSVSRSFHPFSVTSNAATINVSSNISGSDLYTWREIFQLYIEAEVFENIHEKQRGERSVEESEHRLELFAQRVTQWGLGDQRRLKKIKSRDALETFLEVNVFILNIKKFQFANAEATRKILKKHAKRTALPYPQALIFDTQSMSLPRVLVQAIGETLLPVIPHLDDYTCFICMSIAFKPIRLNCGHLFCVRCLVKMQKRGNASCPMCRAPSVLIANRMNVDWALMNFMQDWFPVESRKKLDENEEEVSKEQLEEMGIDPTLSCMVM